MGDSLLTLSDSAVGNDSLALIYSINECNRTASHSEPPYISYESYILLLSILDYYERTPASLPPDEDVVLPKHENLGYFAVNWRANTECTRLRGLLRRWRAIALPRRLANMAMRRMFGAWRQAAEDAYIGDILQVFSQRRLLGALGRWKDALARYRCSRAQELAGAFRRGRMAQLAFHGWVDRYNQCQIAAYGVQIRRLARLFGVFWREYACRRVQRAVDRTLTKCALYGLRLELSVRIFYRLLLRKIALGAVLQQASRLLLTQQQSAARVQTAEKATLARNRMFSGTISHYCGRSYVEGNFGSTAEEDARYFLNVNTRFVYQKVAELQGCGSLTYSSHDYPAVGAEYSSGASALKANVTDSAACLPEEALPAHFGSTDYHSAVASLSEGDVVPQNTAARISYQNSSEEFPGQLEERLGRHAPDFCDCTGHKQQIKCLKERIACLRNLNSTQPLRWPAKRDSAQLFVYNGNEQGHCQTNYPDAFLKQYGAGNPEDGVKKAGNRTGNNKCAQLCQKRGAGSSPRVLALVGLVNAVQKAMARCLLRHAFCYYYMLTLQKMVYSAGLSFALKYCRAKLALKAFSAILVAFRAARAKALTIQRARNACESCQKRYFLSLLRLHGRLSALWTAKQRYLRRELQFRRLARAFSAWRAKSAVLASCGYRQRAIQLKCAAALKRCAFYHIILKIASIRRMSSAAACHDQHRVRFRAFLCLKALQTRKNAFGASNDAFQAIVAEANKLTTSARPGGWYDECFPGVRACFQAWRYRTEYGSTLGQIGQKMLAQQHAALVAVVFIKWRLLGRGLQCARLRAHFLKQKLLLGWRRASMQSARCALLCDRRVYRCRRDAFYALLAELRARRLVYQAEGYLLRRRALRAKLEAFRAIFYCYSGARADRELEALISASFGRFLAFKALFALFARARGVMVGGGVGGVGKVGAGASSAQAQGEGLKNADAGSGHFQGTSRARGQTAGPQGTRQTENTDTAAASIARHMALLKSPAFVFQKCLVWQKHTFGYFYRLQVRSVSYTLEQPQFDFKIVFLSALQKPPTDGVYYTIRARLRTKIFADAASESQKMLTLSQLDSKMAGIQQRIEHLKK